MSKQLKLIDIVRKIAVTCWCCVTYGRSLSQGRGGGGRVDLFSVFDLTDTDID